MNSKLLLFFSLSCILFQDGISQEIEINTNRERNFAFEVKHIDEFFERFNNENDAFITKYVKTHYPGITVDRASLLTNLFNRQNKSWKKNEVNEFFSQVTDSLRPVYLDFYNENWYAEALCKFKYQGRQIDLVILLKIQREANGGAKWMIVSAYSRLISPVKSSVNFSTRTDSRKFLSSMSHATNFISLANALRDKSNISNYLDTNFLKSPSSKGVLRSLLNNELEYQYVKNIEYHFLQVDGWIFTVRRFERESVNSGWLISNLLKVEDKDKKTYRRLLFHQ